jgi:chemotaxis protein MotB
MKSKQSDVTVIRVVRSPRHGKHHGGAWKVAYADFVTAMMAFFLVMWIVGMETDVKELVQGYFSNPVGFKKAFSAGENPLAAGNAPVAMGTERLQLLAREYERRRFEELRDRIRDRLSSSHLLDQLDAQIEIVVTKEGLRIELIESGAGETFFAFGSAAVKPAARRALELIAPELATVPDNIVVEGHTDAAPFGSAGYSNWELSVDRANAARRILEENRLGSDRITGVRGYADRELRVPSEPLNPANRRISILLPFSEPRSFADPEPPTPSTAD